MIETGFESRVKVQQIINNQLPEFVVSESPNAVDFFKQYYISQEYQGGPIDIADNLDQYIKVDNLTPEVIIGSTTLSSGITTSSTVISVDTTKGFPNQYGLLKIDDEIITYTGISPTTFTGCIRGFSGITSYHAELNREELVFSTSSIADHNTGSEVKNLSSLFLKEFYKKLKFSLTPGMEEVDFQQGINVGNFIKEARSLYEAKGTDESFRILFNVLYGETPKVINLEDYLIKPSSAEYIRREIIIAEVISGDPKKLIGQTIYKVGDLTTNASVSEVEPFTRVGVALTSNQQYYKLSLFLGPNDKETSIQGTFSITPASKCLEPVAIGASVISVDSTIGFGVTGNIIAGTNNNITYTNKSVNQFYGCDGIVSEIDSADIIRNNDIYFGYPDGDTSSTVELRLTGVLSKFEQITKSVDIDEKQILSVKNLGDLIENPIRDRTYKEIFANSWIYNTSTRYRIKEGSGSSTLTLYADIDRSSLKVGDQIEILKRGSNTVIHGGTSNVYVKSIINANLDEWWSIKSPQIELTEALPSVSYEIDLRRKLSNPTSRYVPLLYDKTISDTQNLYIEKDENFYVASNSLPSGIDIPSSSGLTGPDYRIPINTQLQSIQAKGLTGGTEELGYGEIEFENTVPFIDGDEIFYDSIGSNNIYVGLETGNYFIGISEGSIDKKRIRLYNSRALINNTDFIKVNTTSSSATETGHQFTLASQKTGFIGPQKIFKKFPFNTRIDDGNQTKTEPGTVGLLINGVEISNYKGNDKIYYGPLESVNVLGEGEDYDVINPPDIQISTGIGTTALVQAVVQGSIKDVLVDPQGYAVKNVISLTASGGNGSAVLEPLVISRSREMSFDGRIISQGGGINTTTNQLSFSTSHTLSNYEEVIYTVGTGNTGIGVGVGATLADNASYFVDVINNTTVQLYESKVNAQAGINTVTFNGNHTSGIHKFITLPNQKAVIGVKVLNGGTFTNRKLRVDPLVGISSAYNTVTFKNHGFNDGDLVDYTYQTTTIAGLSSSNQYYINKIDDNTFKLSNAGVGGTIITNYERGNTISFNNVGAGYQIFSYPDISVSLTYAPVGFGTTTQTLEEMILTPSVRGGIIDTYLYEAGTGYGSTILNFQKNPTISIKNGKNANVKPVLTNGKIDRVNIQYGGSEYFSIPTLNVIDSSGKGTGAKLRPVITDGRISDVIVVNAGIGYSHIDTSINVVSAGKNATLDVKIRPLTINLREKYKNFPNINNDYELESNISETILVNAIPPDEREITLVDDNLKYTICGYGEPYRDAFGEVGVGMTQASKIIGWAYDGNPIYGPYGYDNPALIANPRRLSSGYQVNIEDMVDRPSGFTAGYFVEDYKFTNSGDLDRNNGRFGKTPEFPDGVYAYFATITDVANQSIPEFPYFIGDSYRSTPLVQNITQKFDFKNSNLIRNTFPYRISDKNVDNDFIIETNEIERQKIEVESVTSGSVEKLTVVNAGENYKINDLLTFDDTNTSGNGLRGQVSSLKGIDIVNVSTASSSYTNKVFSWVDDNTVKVTILPSHNWSNKDNIIVSGFSTNLSSLNGLYSIGVSSLSAVVVDEIPSGSAGVSTEIFVSNIPDFISIGSTVKIGTSNTESAVLLNVFKRDNILRIKRGSTGIAWTASTPITFVPDSFTINKSINFFESEPNDKFYFNPIKTVGFGTQSGISSSVTFTFGTELITRDIPTQRIYLENHPFTENQELSFSTGGGTAIQISDASDSSLYALPGTVYVTNASKNTIGIKTGIGSTGGDYSDVFFRSGGSDSNNFLFESNFTQETGRLDQFETTVALSTSHDLKVGDNIVLNIEPQLSVGLGTTTPVKVKRQESTGYLLLDPLECTNSAVDMSADTFTLTDHKFKTGDAVYYESTSFPTGFSERTYFVFVIDTNTIQLCETYIDATTIPCRYVNFTTNPAATHTFSRINPTIEIVNTNSLVFDLTHSSLTDYKFKLYYDKEFKNEFVSTASTVFDVTGIGTVGVGTTAVDSSLTIGYNDSLPRTLYYNIQKSGFISTADTSVPNYSEIEFTSSSYNTDYDIISVGSTTFNISLKKKPEELSYTQNDCKTLVYDTTSLTSKGGINKTNIISSGDGYKKLPNFVGSSSTLGNGAYVVASSTEIGNANETRVINQGFEYSSDNTLQPSAFISPLIVVNNSNTIGIISITDGGSDYLTPPTVVIVDSTTGKKINSGIIEANLTGATITSVEITSPPSGLPDIPVTLFTTNNTNGVGILTVNSNSTGIFTCYITTPSAGFSTFPFSKDDEVFVEGISKVGAAGSGFNSSDYGYKFGKVLEIDSTGSNFRVDIDFSALTTNTGIAVTDQGSLSTLINKNKYPTFTVTQKSDFFIVGEILIRNLVELDLFVTKTESDFIKVSGTDVLSVGDIIRGKDSGTIATISSITEYDGRYSVSFSVKKDIGWTDDIGKLSVDNQVTPNNDYYQNLSYTIQSSKGFDELRSPVSSLLHTSGLKNFADVGIKSTSEAVGPYNESLGRRTGIGSADFSLTVQDILGYNRVDTINDYDTAVDLTTNNISSKFIEFGTKVLSDYFTSKSNEVLVIDDINKEFSNLDGDPSLYLDLVKLSSNVEFQNLFFRVSNSSNTDIQTTDLVLMNNGTTSVLLQKHTVDDDNPLGEFSIYDTGFGESYLRFTPSLNPYDNDYDLKLLKTEFNVGAGIGTYSIGFVDVTGAIGVATTSLIGGGITTSIVSGIATAYNSFHTRNQLINSTTNEMNFVEVYVTHDGTNTYMSEYYIDNETSESYSSNLLGDFTGNISGDYFSLDFENSSTDDIEIRSAIVGFGTTSVGVGTYRFKVEGQEDGTERSALYQSNYTNSSGTRTVVGFDKSLFNAVKSVVEVSIGSTKALHQVVISHNNTSVYTQQGPYLSVGSTSVQDLKLGIGTFGGEYDSSDFVMKFYPNPEFTSDNIEVSSLSLALYTQLDALNINNIDSFDYGRVSESLGLFAYNAFNGDRVNKTNFTLTTNDIPIFGKTFNPSTSSIVDLATGKFSIEDHFFRTGEELVYTPKSTFVGVGSTPMQYSKSGIHQLPSSVFAIRDTADSFYIATTKTDAEAGTALTFVGVGTGNAHELSMSVSNTKGLITIDNIIQSPLAYSPISHTLKYNTTSVLGGVGINTSSTIFSLSGISSLAPKDLLKIDDEYIKILDIGVSTQISGPITPGIGTFTLVEAERGFVGTSATAHLNATTAQLYRGSYNIVGQEIHFSEPPRGNPQITKTSSNLDYPRSDFNGRVYLRSDYSTNQIYDDISDQFTGIGQTFDLSVNGSGAVGMGTSGGNGLVLINHIYQRPTAENNPSNNFIIKEPVGLSTNITFTGIATVSGDSIIINESDINENQLPRGGVIVSLGSTPGLGYALAEGARGYLEIGAGGTITNVVGFATTGPSLSISTVTYNNATGVMDIVTSSSTNFELGIVNQVKLSGLEFSCSVEHAGVTTTIFPEAAIGAGNTDKSYSIFDTTPVLYTHTFVSGTTNGLTASSGASGTFTAASGTTYDSLTGDLVLTIGSHSLTTSNKLTIANGAVTFTCSRDNNVSQHNYPRATDPASGVALSITAVTGTTVTVNVGSSNNGLRRFTTNVGTSTIPHNYVTGGSVMPWYGNATFGSGYSGTVAIGVSDVPFTHKFISATAACVTPNVGTAVTPTAATYNGASGDLVLTALGHGLTDSNTVTIANNSLTFTCSKDKYSSYHSYPRATDPVSGISTAITSYDVNTFTVNVGSSVGSGADITATVGAGGTLAFAITGPGTNYANPQLMIPEASYSNLGVTGVSRRGIGATTDTGTGLLMNYKVEAISLGVDHKFVSAGVGSITATGIGTTTATDASYNPLTGELVLTIVDHGLTTANTIGIDTGSIVMTCAQDNYVSEHPYPRATDPIANSMPIGIGATTLDTITVSVGIATEIIGVTTQFGVTEWEIVRNGYGFKRGDVFKPVGLVTAVGLVSPIIDAEFTVLDTFQDAFSAWQFGQFDYIDDIKNLQDGSRTRFQLKYDGDLLSFEAATDSGYNFINLENALLIIINGVIQEPEVAYQFNGGTSFVFTEPPSPEDDVSIYFYRGTSQSDTQLVTNIIPSIKEGDDVQLMKISETVDQNIRTIAAIENSTTIETNIYTGPGITTTNKSLSWTKQKNDKVVNGDIVYKSRGSLEALIFPTAKIISDLTTTETSQVFIDNSDLFDYDSPFTGNVDALVVDNSVVPVAASLTANVSTAGTISSLTIVDGGTGYSGVSTSLSIAIPPIGISVGVGTTATATATISNGVITAITITNPGLGYDSSNSPKVLAPLPTYKSELLDGVTTVQGFTGIITGIGTTTGVGTDLALKFYLDSTNTNWSGDTLKSGYPIVISNTQIGTGVTSIYESGSGSVGIGTTFLDNIYRLAYTPHSVGALGIITCNIAADTHVSGLSTSGNTYAPVGTFSWGRLSGTITRPTSIGIAVSNYTVNSGLTTFPSLQRRDEGIRDTGALDPS